MNKLVLLAGVALLASCGSKTEPAPDAMATADATMPMDAGATPAAAMTTAPGSYDVTTPDGSKIVGTLMAGGTYVDRDAKDKVVEKGTWADKDGKICFTPPKARPRCATPQASPLPTVASLRPAPTARSPKSSHTPRCKL